MSFKKPFRAVPVKPSERYLAARSQSAKSRIPSAKLVIGGAISGVILGIGIIAIVQGPTSPIISAIKAQGQAFGLIRKRQPASGDFWPSCEMAEAAGVTPLQVGEAGYRAELDADGDGEACEPYP